MVYAFDVAPPGSVMVTPHAPVVRRLFGTVALACVGGDTPVDSGVPAQLTTAPVAKPVPLTCRMTVVA
jgi:hypothetical protein